MSANTVLLFLWWVDAGAQMEFVGWRAFSPFATAQALLCVCKPARADCLDFPNITLC